MKKFSCKNYSIFLNNWEVLESYLNSDNFTKTFVLVDQNTEKYCLHLLLEHIGSHVIVIKINAGEEYKTLDTCQEIWSQLMMHNADRNSILINLGGGVICDMGGFCAATFKRGIHFINIPTTLLSQVDASVGGKTGVDFGFYKNIIGLIIDPDNVYIFTDFLKTLPQNQVKSGLAEVIKHYLIADKNKFVELSKMPELNSHDYETLIWHALSIKKRITEKDPKEKGLRKILNFGHTVGHAVESLALSANKAILHGEAVAIGMICETYLSYRLGNISEEELFGIKEFIIANFGHHPKMVNQEQQLITIMTKDKKNKNGIVQFSLLKSVGDAYFDIKLPVETILESFIFYKQK